MPAGTVLGDFTVTQVIGVGGFGIVYLAHDDVLHRTVALKEYLPITIAGRTSAKTVLVRSTRHTESYVAGLQSFMREARLQARFSHPAMLEVFQVWEQNGTAYMAMRYYPGDSLLKLREDSASTVVFDEEAIRRIMSPVFEGVAVLHAQSVLHRDVAPDNILIMPSGAPVMLDFGSARMVVMGAEQSLTTVLKPGYAPVEQYIADGTMEQGPWTDVYALGAVLYFLAMGEAPPQAVTRMLRGTLDEFETVAYRHYSAQFISAVSASLTVQPTLRLQSVAAFREALGWPDEPAADELKSILVTTMAIPFNAEWRAAQIARQTEIVPPVPPAASDAVTVLVSDPFASSAATTDGRDEHREPKINRAVEEATLSLLANDRQSKRGFTWSINPRWVSVVSLAMLVTVVAMIAQTQSPAATSASGFVSADAAKAKVAPTLKLSTTIANDQIQSASKSANATPPSEARAPSVATANREPPLPRLRTAVPKKSAEDGNANSSAVRSAPTASVANAAPINPIAPAVTARSSPVQKRSAACQRSLSKLAPSEAAVSQSENGQVSECR